MMFLQKLSGILKESRIDILRKQQLRESELVNRFYKQLDLQGETHVIIAHTIEEHDALVEFGCRCHTYVQHEFDDRSIFFTAHPGRLGGLFTVELIASLESRWVKTYTEAGGFVNPWLFRELG